MIQRKPLRDEIQKEIVARIHDGRLAAGQRINETHLSADLGISRTPLREAMLTLAAAGFLDSDMGKGFGVPALDPTEFVDIQALLVRLVPLTISLTGAPAPGRVMELGNLLNRARLPGGQGLAPAEALFRWSWLLAEDCPNRLLRAEVLRFEGLARRYWQAAFDRGLDAGPVLQSLAGIYEMLRTRKTKEAQEAWVDHIGRFTGQARSVLVGSD